MPDYEKLYFHLFNQLTRIMECVEEMNYGLAKQIIIQAQQETENLYIEEE